MRVLAQLVFTSIAVRSAYADIINLHHGAIEKVIIHVRDDIVSLHSTVKSFNGDKEPVVAAAEKLIATIKSGTAAVDSAGKLTTGDSFSLQDPLSSLLEAGFSLADYLKSRRPDVEKANLCKVVLTLVTDINTASQALIDSVIDKFPAMVRPIAKTLSTGLTDELDQTQDAFSTAHCKNSSEGDIPITSPSSIASPASSAATVASVSTTHTTGTTSTTKATHITDTTSTTKATHTIGTTSTTKATHTTAARSTSSLKSSVSSSSTSSLSTSSISSSATISAETSSAGNLVSTSKPIGSTAGTPTSASASIFVLSGAALSVILATILL